jgi:hypothetical protein
MTAPTIGLAEAARACGVSESTLRRKRTELLELGASHGPKGWSIPIPALVQLGLMTPTTAPDTVTAPEPSHDSPVEAVMTPSTREELEALRGALAAAEQRAAVAEAIAQERERIIEVQAQALRMLEAPSPGQPAVPEKRPADGSAASTAEPLEARKGARKWWKWGSS